MIIDLISKMGYSSCPVFCFAVAAFLQDLLKRTHVLNLFQEQAYALVFDVPVSESCAGTVRAIIPQRGAETDLRQPGRWSGYGTGSRLVDPGFAPVGLLLKLNTGQSVPPHSSA
jgi:hypothetical protein